MKLVIFYNEKLPDYILMEGIPLQLFFSYFYIDKLSSFLEIVNNLPNFVVVLMFVFHFAA